MTVYLKQGEGKEAGDYELVIDIEETIDGEDEPRNTQYRVSIEVVEETEEEAEEEEEEIVREEEEDGEEFVFVPDFEFKFEGVKIEEGEVFIPEPPTLSIDSVDKFGLLTISFSQSLIVPQDYETVIDTTVLDIETKPYSSSRKSLVGLTWEVDSYSEDQLVIQLIYDNAKYVSIDSQDWDTLDVKIYKPEFFVT